MKKIVYFLVMALIALVIVGCGSSKAADNPTPKAEATTATSAPAPKTGSGKKLVVYFSHVGENSGVGVITKGNTAIIAEMIAKKVGADLFEVVPENPYPKVYRQTTDLAKKELQEHARPAIKGKVANFDEYDTVFIGYPIWWGDMPMPMFTFIDSYKFTGKKVYPFATHEGSAMGRTESSLRSAMTDADVKNGLAIRGRTAQNNPQEAEKDVDEWLKAAGF